MFALRMAVSAREDDRKGQGGGQGDMCMRDTAIEDRRPRCSRDVCHGGAFILTMSFIS